MRCLLREKSNLKINAWIAGGYIGKPSKRLLETMQLAEDKEYIDNDKSGRTWIKKVNKTNKKPSRRISNSMKSLGRSLGSGISSGTRKMRERAQMRRGYRRQRSNRPILAVLMHWYLHTVSRRLAKDLTTPKDDVRAYYLLN